MSAHFFFRIDRGFATGQTHLYPRQEKTKREQMNSASFSVCECLLARNNCVFGIMLVFLDTHTEVEVCTIESFFLGVWV